MEQSRMEDFIANAALLAGHLTQQCEKATAEQQSSANELKRAAAEVGKGVAEGRAELAQSTRSAVREALSQEIPAAVEAITDSSARLRQLAEQLQRDQLSAAASMRMLAWKSLAMFVVAAAIIIGGTGYSAWSNVKRARAAQVQADVMEALQKVSITTCDGKPCVKLADGQPRWGRNDDYILIDTQAPAKTAD